MTKATKATKVMKKVTAKNTATLRKAAAGRSKAKAAEQLPPSVQGVSAAELDQLAAAFERGICVQVQMGQIGIRRMLPSSEIELLSDVGKQVSERANKSLVRATKVIFSCPEYDAIELRTRRIKDILKRRGLQTILQRSLYLIPIAQYASAMGELDAEIAARAAAVDVFMNRYVDIQASAKEQLRGLYRAADYPPADTVRATFYVTIRRGFRVAVDDKLRSFDPAAYATALTEERAERAAAVADFRAVLRETLAGLVAHLADKLSGKSADGRPKVLRESAVSNIAEFIDLFDDKNVAGDGPLREQVERMRGLLKGVDVGMIHDDQAFRDALGARVTAVRAALEPLVQDAPTRRMRWVAKKEAAA